MVSLTDYGAFVELEPGVEGLIHVSEMSWSKRVKHPSKILNVGDSVEAMVLGVDPAARRISLGLKQVESNPWNELAEKYPVGTRIKGKVRNLTEFGAFVEVEEDIDGLIHISDMSWSKRVKHPSEVLKKGDVVEAMVLSIDAENQRLSLGLKQLATDIWEDFFSRHKVGDTIEGKVVRMTNFGAFVELDEGIEGLIHVSEFDDTQGGREDLPRGRPDHADEDHQAEPLRAEDRPEHSRAQDATRSAPIGTTTRRRRAMAAPRSASICASSNDGVGTRASLGQPDSQATTSIRSPTPTPELPDPEPRFMTKAELVEEVSRVSDLTKKHSEVIVDTVFQSIIDALHRGEKIELRGFGSFRLRKREPRKGRNPKTGDKVDVPPKRVPYFKPGKELKDLINRMPDGPVGRRHAVAVGLRALAPWSGSVASWRHAYVTRSGEHQGCVFCNAQVDPEAAPLIVHQGALGLRHPQSLPLQRRPPADRAAPPSSPRRRR